MVATTTATPLMTAEEFYEWANASERAGGYFELVNGKVIDMPSPGRYHGTICWLIARLLGNYLFTVGRGSIATNDSGLIVRRQPDTVRGPDIMLFLETIPDEQIDRGHTDDVPDLIVEVRSPSDRESQMIRRVEQYRRLGVRLVWVVDPDERVVTVYQGNSFALLEETDTITGNDILPEFTCRVADFFALPGGGQN